MKKVGKYLINSKEYVREPVDKEVNKILNSSENRIILKGRGTGRSAVLCSLEKRGLGSHEQTIYYDPIYEVTINKEPNKYYNHKIFDYYYELNFANNILIYIRNNYPILYEKEFKKDKELVAKYIKRFIYQINYQEEDTCFDIELTTAELSSKLISRLMDKMEIDKINLAFDDFDKMYGSSEYAQNTHAKYFDIFDKVILSSNDSNLKEDELEEKGYSIKQIKYGNDKDALREIIRQRKTMEEDAKNYKGLFTTDLFLDRLTSLDGNIDFSLRILNDVRDIINYNNEQNIDKVLDESIKKEKKLSKKYPSDIKLYI